MNIQVFKLYFWQKIFLSSWVCLLLGIIFYWFHTLYRSLSFADYLLSVQMHFKNSYLIEDISKNFLLEGNYHFFQSTMVFWLILLLFLFVIFVFISYKSTLKFPDFYRKEFIHFQPKELTYLYVFLILWLCLKVFLFNYLPLHIDEVFDYQFFAKNNLLTRHSYQFCDGHNWYNNHVLYSDLVALFHTIGLPLKLAIRLPSILGEFLILLLIVRRIQLHSFFNLIFVLFGISCSFWFAIYGVEGRSYMLMACCCIYSFVLLHDMIISPSKLDYYALLIISCIGFALSKLYILPFCGIFFYYFLLTPNAKNLAWFIAFNVSVLILTFLFYFPVLFLGGIQNLYQNTNLGFVQEMTLTPQLFEISSFVTNINSKSYLAILILILIIFLFRHKQSKNTKLLLLFVIALTLSFILATFLLGTYLPCRVFVYYNLMLWLYVLLFVVDIVHKKKIKGIIICLVAIALSFNFWYNTHYSWAIKYKGYILDKQYYMEVIETIEKIKKIHPNSIFIPKKEHNLGFYTQAFLGDSMHINFSETMKDETMFLSDYKHTPPNYTYLTQYNKQFIYIKINWKSVRKKN